MKKRDGSYRTIKNYLKNLVSQTDHIKEVIGLSRSELNNNLSSRTKPEDPLLVLWGYEAKLDGNNKQHTRGVRKITFSIVYRCKPSDYAAQEKAYELSELYGVNLISRIHWDALTHQYRWLSHEFDKDSVTWNLVEYDTANGLFGCEFTVTLTIKDSLSVDPEFWKDKKDYCNYI